MVINCRIGLREFFVEKPERAPFLYGFPENFGVAISGFLYRGSLPMSEHSDVLKRLHIREVISLYSLSSEYKQTIEVASFLKANGFQHKLYNTDLGERIFLEAIQYIVQRVGKDSIYLHCTGGSNRTGQVVVMVKLLLGQNNFADLLVEAISYGFNWQNASYCNFLGRLIEISEKSGMIDFQIL